MDCLRDSPPGGERSVGAVDVERAAMERGILEFVRAIGQMLLQNPAEVPGEVGQPSGPLGQPGKVDSRRGFGALPSDQQPRN